MGFLCSLMVTVRSSPRGTGRSQWKQVTTGSVVVALFVGSGSGEDTLE
jgi:hypothetical protein